MDGGGRGNKEDGRGGGGLCFPSPVFVMAGRKQPLPGANIRQP